MKKLTSVNAVQLAIGIQSILLDMVKEGKEAKYPVREFERLICETKQVSKQDAERVTEKVINTGIIRGQLCPSCFVL